MTNTVNPSEAKRPSIELTRADPSCRTGHDWRHIFRVMLMMPEKSVELDVWNFAPRDDQDPIICIRCKLISIVPLSIEAPLLDAIERAAAEGRAP